MEDTNMVAMQSAAFNTMKEAQEFAAKQTGLTKIVPEVAGWSFDTKGHKHNIPKKNLKVWVEFDFQ
jgi:hypothetical protein